MKLNSILFICMFTLGFITACDSSDPNSITTVTIHHSNDIFGYLEPCG